MGFPHSALHIQCTDILPVFFFGGGGGVRPGSWSSCECCWPARPQSSQHVWWPPQDREPGVQECKHLSIYLCMGEVDSELYSLLLDPPWQPSLDGTREDSTGEHAGLPAGPGAAAAVLSVPGTAETAGKPLGAGGLQERWDVVQYHTHKMHSISAYLLHLVELSCQILNSNWPIEPGAYE